MKIKEFISKEKIEKRIEELAEQIDKEYNGKTIQFVCVLKGASVFAIQLAMKIKSNVRLEFVEVSSYEGTKSTGKIKINKELAGSIEGKDVIIVEDIIDTGLTLSVLKEYMKEKNPKSLKICTLLDKPERREKNVKVDYCGFTIENKFVLGYGLDVDEDYRNLPYIGVIE